MAHKQKWFRRHPRLTLAAMVLLFPIVADGLLGWIMIPPDTNAFREPHPVYHHGLRPNRTDTATWGRQDYPMITNSLGFRDGKVREVALQSPGKRLLLMGDSFGEGLGVAYEESFAGLLADSLGKKGIEVLNGSAVSYSPKLHYLKVRHLIEQGLEFDRLLVLIDISDPQNEVAYEAFEPAPFDWLGKLKYDLKRFALRSSFTWHWFAQRSQRASRAFAAQYGDPDLFPCLVGIADRLTADPMFLEAQYTWTLHREIYEKYGKPGTALGKANMARLARLCKDRSIQLSIAVYPWPDQIKAKDIVSIQVQEWQTFAEKHGVPFLNLFPEFINSRPAAEVLDRFYIPGDVHWNAAGHELVARKLEGFLR